MHKDHVVILDVAKDPNIGIYGFATDRYCIVGKAFKPEQVSEIKQKLNVEVVQTSLYGTDLIGLFAAGTSSTLLIPSICFENEIAFLRTKLQSLGVKLIMIDTKHTALGNNILLNDFVGIVSTVFSKKDVEKIKAALGIDIIQMDLAGTHVPGSVGVLTNQGALFSPNLSESEINYLEKLFGFEIGLGTVNLGNPFVATGLFANSFGFAVGSASSGWEIARIDESLGFLKSHTKNKSL
ncbi:MAG: translation initiation factor IF-6 [Candidatus Nanoarchaeia archaeon]